MKFATEDQFQAYCMMWYDKNYPQFRRCLFAVPNGGERPGMAARLMQATGTKRGVCDLILVNFTGVDFIELKIPGGSQSDDQREFEIMVTDRGHEYFLLWNFEQFRALIIEKLGEPFYG